LSRAIYGSDGRLAFSDSFFPLIFGRGPASMAWLAKT
jgi:hypothetical protein